MNHRILNVDMLLDLIKNSEAQNLRLTLNKYPGMNGYELRINPCESNSLPLKNRLTDEIEYIYIEFEQGQDK